MLKRGATGTIRGWMRGELQGGEEPAIPSRQSGRAGVKVEEATLSSEDYQEEAKIPLPWNRAFHCGQLLRRALAATNCTTCWSRCGGKWRWCEGAKRTSNLDGVQLGRCL